MKRIQIIAVAVTGFFSPTLLSLMMFSLFGLKFQPDEFAAVVLTFIGLLTAIVAVAIWVTSEW